MSALVHAIKNASLFPQVSRFVENSLARAWHHWEKFWFESNQPVQVRVFRSLLGALLLCTYLIRTLDLQFYYSESGLLTVQQLGAVLPMDYRFSIFHHLNSDFWLWTFNGIFLLSLTGMMLNRFPRISTVVAMLLHASFLHRNMVIMFGIDMVAAFYLFYLCFVDDRVPEDGSRPFSDWKSSLGSAVFRLMQIQVCIIYAYSGMEKLKGPAWWNGEALWTVLTNPLIARFDFSWLSQFPFVILAATYLSVLWEIYFPALVWVKKIRYPLLVFGVMMHVAIGVTISIPFFGAIMILTYILFLDEKHASTLKRRLKLR